MHIGVPTETRDHEDRVALTPAGVREIVERGHSVIVQAGAGLRCGMPDGAYRARGAKMVETVEEVYAGADVIAKVAEPQAGEVELLQPRHILLAYLHLATAPELARDLATTGAACIACETVEDAVGGLPLLAPMSEIAGRLAAQVAACSLMSCAGGAGRLFGGVPGVQSARVVVIGGGAAGTHAAQVALGMGAQVTVVERSPARMRTLALDLSGRAAVHFATSTSIEELVVGADVVIGAVLTRAARAPKLLRREHLAVMRRGGVVVDVAIDQGGCFQTSIPTTLADPTYKVDGILHYCVPNMPSAVPASASQALTSATLPYVVEIADRGLDAALDRDPGLRRGMNVAGGAIVHTVVAREVETAFT